MARQHGQAEWLAGLPELVEELAERWALGLEEPFSSRPGVSWVAPAGGLDGIPVVLKVGMPSRESRTEAAGLRFFAGQGAVRLLRSDDEVFALVEERCQSGEDLWSLEVAQGNAVAAEVLRRLWRPAPEADQIELLADLAEEWIEAFFHRPIGYPARLTQMAAELAAELSGSQPHLVVLHGDFNPGNVLASGRGWLSIDCKPLVGEPAFDLAQLLANRLGASAGGPADQDSPVFTPSVSAAEIARQVDFFAETLDLDRNRILGWTLVKALAWDWGPETAGVFAELVDGAGR